MVSAAQPPSRALPRGARLLLLVLIAFGPVPVLADPAPGTRTVDSKIVFHTSRYTSFEEICTMNPDGTDVTRLTFLPSYWSTCAALSPDGTRIAFESNRTYNLNHIYIMNVDGSDQHRVTTVPNEEAHAAWSPCGTKIACSAIVDGAYDIFTMNADGTNRLRLTTSPGPNAAPEWSPDGTRILFVSARTGHWGLYVMNANGTDQRPLLNSPYDLWGPRWSPDGSKIVYVMIPPPPQHWTIHVVNADGTGDVPIRDTGWDNADPDWAPDRSRIAFASWEYGSAAEICSMLPDGTDVRRLTFDLTGNRSPSWGPTPATSAVNAEGSRAAVLALANPARARADLRFHTEQAGPGSLEIFDSAGRLVRTLLRGPLTPGSRSVSWDGRDDAGRPMSNGLYHCRFITGAVSQSAKIVYLQ